MKYAFYISICFSLLFSCSQKVSEKNVDTKKPPLNKIADTVQDSILIEDSIQIINGTYLGGERRDYYGNYLGNSLNEIWKFDLGTGQTYVNPTDGVVSWSGAGWTGQPLIVKEKDTNYIIQGAFDHHLKKINLETGKLVWQYKYDDVLKGTGTIWDNPNAEDPKDRLVIIQGSRKGLHNSLSAKIVHSLRAVSYFTGKELWRINVKRTQSYSRDVDASALILDDTAYIGLENGRMSIFNPDPSMAVDSDTCFEMNIPQDIPLFNKSDRQKHGGNLVTESSPVRLGNRVYLASGSGHIYGYNLQTDSIDWDFYTGSDIDGTPAVTSDSCLIVTIEKQYIKGKGGVFKLDPSKIESESVEWFFPTENIGFADWKGGIIGSASINDGYNSDTQMSTFAAIDGFLYLVNHKKISDKKVKGPNLKFEYDSPVLLDKYKIGPSISTPLFIGNKILVAGYKGIYLFSISDSNKLVLLDLKKGTFESTPYAFDGKILVASRNGNLYCLGDSTFNESLAFENNYWNPNYKVEKLQSVENKSILAICNFTISDNNVKKLTASKPESFPILEDVPEIKISQVENLEKRYHNIAGVFSDESNSIDFTEKMKKKGFETIRFKVNSKYYVSIDQSETKDEAERKKKQLSVSNWVYKK